MSVLFTILFTIVFAFIFVLAFIFIIDFTLRLLPNKYYIADFILQHVLFPAYLITIAIAFFKFVMLRNIENKNEDEVKRMEVRVAMFLRQTHFIIAEVLLFVVYFAFAYVSFLPALIYFLVCRRCFVLLKETVKEEEVGS